MRRPSGSTPNGRMSDQQRHSVAEEAPLIDDPEQVARLEAENAVRQFDRVLDLIDDIARSGRPFRLRASTILDLHRIALTGLSRYAGLYRPLGIEIVGSGHVPPDAHLIANLIEEMCDEVERRFLKASALRLCAYVMWRLNWIHPFTDGNGRTSRALAYYVLCAKLGYRLGGSLTIPEQIASEKRPYYDALEAADLCLDSGSKDVSELERLLGDCLAKQLTTTFEDASSSQSRDQAERTFH